MRQHKVEVLVEGAVMVALGLTLSFVKIYQAPYGGSVTLGSMIPILLFAMRRGAGPGVAAGIVHGILQYMIEPFFVHPAQVLLDYPLAFGLLGLSGFMGQRAVLGAAVGIMGRFVSHYLSGVIFFASAALDNGINPYLYSLLYNGAYLLPELIISAVILRYGLHHMVEKATAK